MGIAQGSSNRPLTASAILDKVHIIIRLFCSRSDKPRDTSQNESPVSPRRGPLMTEARQCEPIRSARAGAVSRVIANLRPSSQAGAASTSKQLRSNSWVDAVTPRVTHG